MTETYQCETYDERVLIAQTEADDPELKKLEADAGIDIPFDEISEEDKQDL